MRDSYQTHLPLILSKFMVAFVSKILNCMANATKLHIVSLDNGILTMLCYLRGILVFYFGKTPTILTGKTPAYY